MSLRVPEGRVWLDGRLVPAEDASVPLDDLGLQWGFGVFETLAVRGGRPLQLAEHLGRLEHGAGRLTVRLPSRSELESACEAIAPAAPDGWLKILATRSGRCAVFGGSMEAGEEGGPATAVLVKWTRSPADPLAGLKTLSYAHSALAADEAMRRGADEGIWRNSRGHLAEASGSNLFVVHRGRIFTPSVSDGILPGITRAVAIRAAKGLGLVVHEGKVRLDRLERAHEAFLTSSVRGVRPLTSFEGRRITTGAGPITLAIAAEVARRREGALAVGMTRREGA